MRPESSLPRVPLDAEKFKQAVLNLVINALEAMPEGGSLVLGASVRAGELLVEVSDTGPGIPPEIQQDLFKPYFSTKTRGTGMGLALTEKLVGQHGGRIDFRTGPWGTTFCIAIPLEPTIGGQGSNHERRILPHPGRRRRAEYPLRAGAGSGGGVVQGLDGAGCGPRPGTCSAACPISS